MGSKGAKAGTADNAIFKLYSNGYYTGKDPYIYNFSRAACVVNARAMVGDYQDAMEVRKEHQEYTINDVTKIHSGNAKWDQTLKARFQAGRQAKFLSDHIRRVAYRPFVATHCYADDLFSKRPGIRGTMFPDAAHENRAICVPGVGSPKPFSALVVDLMPDIQLMFNGQCFPRYRYRQPTDAQGALPGVGQELERIDNITDTAVRAFRVHYNDNTITKEGIFDYVYGVLHAPGYRERFANDLAKELPRLPLAHDFHAFTRAGHELAKLHLGYETCEAYPLEIAFAHDGKSGPEQFRIGEQAMRFHDDEKTVLRVNEHVSLRGIPASAHTYQVNGRTPLEWFIDRYRITQDKESGIVNDPNAWFDDPRQLIAVIRRIVHVSVESMRIVEGLPEPILEPKHL